MDQTASGKEDLAKLANSTKLPERQQALEVILSEGKLAQQEELVEILLQDPEEKIANAMMLAVLQQAPREFIGYIRQAASGAEHPLRVNCLECLLTLRYEGNAELFIARIPYEEKALSDRLVAGVERSLTDSRASTIAAILMCMASLAEEVRLVALELFTKIAEQNEAAERFFSYTQSVAPEVRERLFIMAEEERSHFIQITRSFISGQVDQGLRLQALNLLSFLKYEQLEQVLLEELNGPDWVVRYAAMQELAKRKSERAKPLIVKMLDERATSVQALAALNQYADKELGPVFLKKLGRADGEEQIEVLRALQTIVGNDVRYIPPLLKFVEHPVSKDKAKDEAMNIILEICRSAKVGPPKEVVAAQERIRQERLNSLPDLGLKLSERYSG